MPVIMIYLWLLQCDILECIVFMWGTGSIQQAAENAGCIIYVPHSCTKIAYYQWAVPKHMYLVTEGGLCFSLPVNVYFLYGQRFIKAFSLDVNTINVHSICAHNIIMTVLSFIACIAPISANEKPRFWSKGKSPSLCDVRRVNRCSEGIYQTSNSKHLFATINIRLTNPYVRSVTFKAAAGLVKCLKALKFGTTVSQVKNYNWSKD